jgi:hypothetical protein
VGNNLSLLRSGVPWRNKFGWQIKPLPPSLWFLLLVLLGSFFGSSPAKGCNAILPVSGSRVPFAIDDFDGDLHPGVATVQSVSSNSSHTIDEVQLELNAGGPQYIHLVGPAGGPRIVARDVNGDDIPDLLISSAWRGEPHAVFLNEGRPAFSFVDPSTFPRAFITCDNTLNGNLRPRRTVWQYARSRLSEIFQDRGTSCILAPRPLASFLCVSARPGSLYQQLSAASRALCIVAAQPARFAAPFDWRLVWVHESSGALQRLGHSNEVRTFC